MIMSSEKSTILSNTNDVHTFTIAGTSNIFETLSSRLYTNPKRAVIREVVSNAIDANIQAGNDNPITLHLPSTLEPEFYVEDHGIGMSDETISKVYTQYGNSTKDGSNDCIGGLGLGSKTPFSYTDQFFVTSAKDGIRNTYICFKNEENLPSITKTDSVECGSETGTRVSFPVNESDISGFAKEAASTLLFTMKMPKVTGNLDGFLYNADVESLEEYIALRNEIAGNTYINNDNIRRLLSRSSYDTVLVEMGGVAYNVSISEIMPEDTGIIDYMTRNVSNLIFHLPIGSVNIQSSREALHYTKSTKETLTKVFIKAYFKKVSEVLSEDASAVSNVA